jgi:hypothetical protein
VNPDYFRALRVKLVSGRFFEERDNFDAPEVAIVNEAFVRRFFPNEDPIGEEVTVWFAKTKIIGVTSDFKMSALDQKTMTEVISDSLWLKRLSATLIGLVAMLAILLAGAGIYSVSSIPSVSAEKRWGFASPSAPTGAMCSD